MTDSGKLNHNSTPLARQVASDFARLAEASEEAGEWGDRVADKVLDAFRDETLIEEYIRLDPAILRSRCCASSYAPPGGETKESEEEDEGSEEEGAGTFMCTEIDHADNLPCMSCFSTYKGYLSHIRRRHLIIDTIAQAVVTNQCFMCSSTFRTRAAATVHVKSVLNLDGHRTCKCDRSVWNIEAVMPTSLHCPICSSTEAQDLPSLQRHIARHFDAPLYIELGDLPVDGERQSPREKARPVGRQQRRSRPSTQVAKNWGSSWPYGREHHSEGDGPTLAEAEPPDSANHEGAQRVPTNYHHDPYRHRLGGKAGESRKGLYASSQRQPRARARTTMASHSFPAPAVDDRSLAADGHEQRTAAQVPSGCYRPNNAAGLRPIQFVSAAGDLHLMQGQGDTAEETEGHRDRQNQGQEGQGQDGSGAGQDPLVDGPEPLLQPPHQRPHGDTNPFDDPDDPFGFDHSSQW